MKLLNLFAPLALEQLEPVMGPAQLVFEPQHDLHAGEVEPELGGQPLDQAQPLEVCLGVETGVSAGALGTDETLALVDAQRLGVHADQLGRDRDHVARTVVHHCSASSSCSRAPGHMRSMTASPASWADIPS